MRKKCTLYTGKYGILFCFVSSVIGVNLYTSFQKYCCFWLEKQGSTYTRKNTVKGRTFANPAAHPHPNYMGVPPSPGNILLEQE